MASVGKWIVAFVALALLTTQVVAGTAGDITGLKVIGHRFSTHVASSKKNIFVTTPSKARYLILKFEGTVSTDNGRYFCADFVLKIVDSSGRETRSRCKAILTAKTADPNEFSKVGVGPDTNFVFNKGTKYFGLAFVVGTNVRTVEILRPGVPGILYDIGADRPYSVHLTTNTDPVRLEIAAKTLRSGGYQVKTSNKLGAANTGITINYAAGAEGAAREISQRLMLELQQTATLKKSPLAGASDIVIWLGK